MKKIKIYGEIIYLLSLIIISFSVAMLSAVDFGISMIVAPAYILSKKLGITFGQSEYIIQAILFIVFCIIVKKIKPIFLVSFLTCLIYGWILDLWRVIIPAFNPQITPPGTLDLWVRIVFFIVGMVLTSLAVALSFKAYIYPQVYDFFVSETTKFYNISVSKFKTIFDMSFLALGVIMSLVFFQGFVGVNWGTLVMAVFNGSIISFFSKTFDKFFEPVPLLKRFSKLFEI